MAKKIDIRFTLVNRGSGKKIFENIAESRINRGYPGG